MHVIDEGMNVCSVRKAESKTSWYDTNLRFFGKSTSAGSFTSTATFHSPSSTWFCDFPLRHAAPDLYEVDVSIRPDYVEEYHLGPLRNLKMRADAYEFPQAAPSTTWPISRYFLLAEASVAT